MLHRRLQETIRHEARQALEIEGRRATLGGRDHEVVLRPRDLLVQILDLGGEEVVLIEGIFSLAQAQGGEGLRDSVGYATENLG
jgi:hypothetical protein